MAAESRPAREIDGKGRSIRELLANRKYSIDYYQREYKWQKKQLTELIEDLSEKFLDSHDEANERRAVAEYGHYFLGSIIISDKDGEKFVIDGQQRLTTLTLLLIYIRHALQDEDQRRQISDLICSTKYGKNSFNLDVPDRTPCMEALYEAQEYVAPETQESNVNIVARYNDLDDCFPDELRGDALPYFADWLVENVQLVEITAYSDSDAYTIFETMNDRGLSLTPADMLKGYLLANVTDVDARQIATTVWRRRITALNELGKDEDADAIKSWLRSQYAATIRDRRRGAAAQDFDLIGTEFHRWVKNEETRLGLHKSADYQRFIEKDFVFYSLLYERLRRAATALTPGLESVYFNAEHNFTLQYPVLLAPVRMDDDPATIDKKLRVTASYLDILINRRIWNWRAIDYSAMQYAMFNVMRDIRGLDVDALVKALSDKLVEVEDFSGNEAFRLHGTNGPAVHRVLARITAYIEERSGMPSRYVEYARRGGKDAFEIEHIWAAHPERHTNEFGHQSEFMEYRNRIGDLLLLPKSDNASYGDLPYEKKLPFYDSQNLLARSLNPNAYDHNPGFLGFVKASGLPFKAHPVFNKADLDDRQSLYAAIADEVWSPARLERDAAS